MEIGATTSTFNTPAADQLSSRQDVLDQVDFLQMLMAQMRNQDPMSPMDGQEYAAQIAQFSSVQELSAIKESLDESINMNLLMTQSINGNLAAALVGKTVRAQDNTVNVTGSGADLRFSLGAPATNIEVQVRNAEGEVIRTITSNPHDAGDAAVYWDGRDDSGNRVPNGEFTFDVVAKDADGAAVNATTYIQGVVSAINYAGGQVTLTVNGHDLQLGDILSVVAGDSSPTDGENVTLRG